MYPIYGTPLRLTASALVHTGQGHLFSFLVGIDAVNDPIIAIYDDTDGATPGNQIVPSTTYDASILGINGAVFTVSKRFTTGLYVAIANIGTGSIVIDWRSQGDLFPNKMH